MSFQPSKLGSKEHWDNVYRREIDNHNENPNDIGEVWFGEDVVERVVRWLEERSQDSASSVLDIGCGNGYTLIRLAEEGYTNLTGIDYSEAGIKLARDACGDHIISYAVVDILADTPDKVEGSPFRLCYDKGTYDAISLMEDGAHQREKYCQWLLSVMPEGGLFIITSCNWTEEEVAEQFTACGLRVVDTISAPTIRFGGVAGQTTATVILER